MGRIFEDYRVTAIERANRETQEYRNRNVDRFNPSTQANYRSVNDWCNYQNELTFKENNGQFPGRRY